MSRKPDKFMQEMGRIRRARQALRAKREQERLLEEEASLWGEKWEDFQDEVEFRSREFGALGREVARGAGREFGNLGKGILKEGVHLAVDVVTAAATLGLVQPTSSATRKNGRRRRR